MNETPLHIAAKKNSREIGEIFISQGADIKSIDIIYQKMNFLFFVNII